jgi:hypothetical protein
LITLTEFQIFQGSGHKDLSVSVEFNPRALPLRKSLMIGDRSNAVTPSKIKRDELVVISFFSFSSTGKVV